MSRNPSRRVAVVGATGVAGQQFLVSLADHPWFEVVALAASERSAGKPYCEAISDAGGHLRWGCEEALPDGFGDRTVVDAAQLDLDGVDLVFSAVESDAARALEERFAAHVPVNPPLSDCRSFSRCRKRSRRARQSSRCPPRC